MLPKIWKKVLLAVCIIACIFDIMSKLVNRNSLEVNLKSVNDGKTIWESLNKDEKIEDEDIEKNNIEEDNIKDVYESSSSSNIEDKDDYDDEYLNENDNFETNNNHDDYYYYENDDTVIVEL